MGFPEEKAYRVGDKVCVDLPKTCVHLAEGWIDKITTRDDQPPILKVFLPDTDELAFLYLYPWEVT